jgi:hypothetical protein
MNYVRQLQLAPLFRKKPFFLRGPRSTGKSTPPGASVWTATCLPQPAMSTLRRGEGSCCGSCDIRDLRRARPHRRPSATARCQPPGCPWPNLTQENNRLDDISASFIWARTYHRQLIHEDVRDATAIKNIDDVETLLHLLPSKVGAPLSIPGLRGKLVDGPATMKALLACSKKKAKPKQKTP